MLLSNGGKISPGVFLAGALYFGHSYCKCFLPLNTEGVKFAFGKQNMKVNVNLGKSLGCSLPRRLEAIMVLFIGMLKLLPAVAKLGPAAASQLVLALLIFAKCDLWVVPQLPCISHQI